MNIICSANLRSWNSEDLSIIKYIKSNRDKMVGGNCKFLMTESLGLYLDSIGLALARIEVLAFNWQTIPALATEMVYYSMTSCNMVRVLSVILSNSSMQHIPLSLRTKAPDSKIYSLVSGSLVT